MAAPEYYRIGDFAKKLGVTPDLLKYCEKKGLISSVKPENGYRYYDFTQAAIVLEYIKLKNQGFSAEQAYSILHAGGFQAFAAHEVMLEEKIKKQINYLQALRRYVDELKEIQDYFTDLPRWNLRKLPAFYFLPHSTGHRFEEDTDMSRIAQWTSWMPVVCSARKTGRLEEQQRTGQWGLAVFEDFAVLQDLDTSPPAELIPSRISLEIFIARDPDADPSRHIRDACALLGRLNLRQTHDAYSFSMAKLWKEDQRKAYSILCIPVEDNGQERKGPA